MVLDDGCWFLHKWLVGISMFKCGFSVREVEQSILVHWFLQHLLLFDLILRLILLHFLILVLVDDDGPLYCFVRRQALCQISLIVGLCQLAHLSNLFVG